MNGVDIDAEPVDLEVSGMLVFSNSTASLPMSTESQLREKLRKIEALFAGPGRPASASRRKQRWNACGSV